MRVSMTLFAKAEVSVLIRLSIVQYGKMLDDYLAQAWGRGHAADRPTPPASRTMDIDPLLQANNLST